MKAHPRQRSFRKRKSVARLGRTNDDGSVVPLARLCLLSLADNMKDVWVKDYADNYMDQYAFRYIMGPFNYLREFVGIRFLALTIPSCLPLAPSDESVPFGRRSNRSQ